MRGQLPNPPERAAQAPTSPALPLPRGPLSAAIITALSGKPRVGVRLPTDVTGTHPYGDDVQLALQVCYELHYRGFAGVDADWEWHPGLLRTRDALERRFLSALRAEVAGGGETDGVAGGGEVDGADGVGRALDELLAEPVEARGLTHWLRDEGTWWQLREYLVHRSIYHLKEADPHAWVIPRLRGQAKAALVAVEFDEFGGGRYERMHSRLYADLLDAAGLHTGYLHYIEHVPPQAFAPVNLMSLLGLHRGLRGGLVGHFAAAEISTAPSARRMVHALNRLGAPGGCAPFFTEHIEADAVHEQVVRHEVIEDLLQHEPWLAADVVFGVRATELLEGRLADHLLGQWRAGESSLRLPLEQGTT